MNQSPPAQRRRGFTLIELLLVVVVLGLLASVATPKFYRTVTRSKVNQAAGVVAADLEHAVSLASRMRRPVTLAFQSPAGYTIRDRATSPADTLRLNRDLSMSEQGGVEGMTFSRSTVQIFPNGGTDGALIVTVTGAGLTKTVSLTTAGMVRKN